MFFAEFLRIQRRHYVGRTVEPPRGFTGRRGGTGGCQQKSESVAVEGLEMVSVGTVQKLDLFLDVP